MSNLHVSLDEANKHTPKGFDNAPSNNTIPWKDENDLSTYTENFKLPRAINFVDGTAVAPTTVDGAIYVIIGSGVLDASWGTLAAFGDWVRFANGSAVAITPAIGTLCFDDTAAAWKEYDGSVWAAHVSATTNLSEGANTLTTVDVDSSTGTNATLLEASTSRAGLLGKAKWDEIVANTSKAAFPEAPNDGTQYARKNLGWEAVAGSNLYTADGTLTALRTVTMATNALSFLGGKVGFGKTAPTFNVHIEDAISSNNGLKVGNSTNLRACIINTGGGIDLYNTGATNVVKISESTNSFFNTGANFGFGISTPIYKVHIQDPPSSSKGLLINNTSDSRNTIINSVGQMFQNNGAGVRVTDLNSYSNSYFNSGFGYAFGLTVPTARIHVKGAGATSGTTALLVENSAGTDALVVKDDGKVGIGVNAVSPDEALVVDGSIAYAYTAPGATYSGSKRVGIVTEYYNAITSTTTQAIHQFTGNSTTVMTLLQGGNVGIGEAAPTARLQVKGAGTTSATTALLVEDSAGTDALEVKDDGSIHVAGVAGFTGTGAYTNFTIKNGIITAAS